MIHFNEFDQVRIGQVQVEYLHVNDLAASHVNNSPQEAAGGDGARGLGQAFGAHIVRRHAQTPRQTVFTEA
jgi:hypothetical protein